MRFSQYRSLDDLADLWARDPKAPGDRDRLYRALVDAICDGAFFEDGLAIRAHALLRAMDPDSQSRAPFSKGVERQPDGDVKAVAAERLPDYQAVHNRLALHGYLGAPAGVPEIAASDPEVFFDWVKSTDPTSPVKPVCRLFSHIAISLWAFRNWCRATGRTLPGFVADLSDPVPADPNHRGACPLPEADLISLCEAVTWLTTGRARPASVVRRLMRRHRGGRWPRGLWREMEEDAARLVAALRRGDIMAYGQLDGGPHAVMPRDYFVSDVFAEFMADVIAPDPEAWLRGTYPEALPTYRAVRFRREELWDAMQKAVRKPNDRPGHGPRATVAAGRRCLRWLIGLMRAGPPEAAKEVYWRQASQEFGVSKRQFTAVWTQALQDVGNLDWAKPGPKPRQAKRRLPDGSSLG